MICLINPADVVAVPPIDNYGKLRTCAYLPIGTIKYDENGDVIPYNLKDGVKSEFVQNILYNGEKNDNDENPYTFNIPDIPEINKEEMLDNLMDIARQTIEDRVQ